MEKITNIEIKNFKSIRHQKIDGCKRINVFIGYPNVGKSNILEALSCFIYAHDPKPNFKDLCRYNNSREIFFDGRLQQAPLQININGKLILRFRFISNSILSLGGKEFEDDEVGLAAISLSDMDLDNIKSFNYYIENGKAEVIDFFKNDSFIIKKYSFNSLRNETFANDEISLSIPFGENLSDIIQNITQLRKQVADLFKTYNLKLLLDKGEASIRVAKTIDEETIFSVPFFQIADTLQRLIFYKAAIASNQKSVLLFEEPEAHMFPPYIKSLTSDIIFDKNDNQYFIATHSPFVLNELIEEAQNELSVYVVDYDKGETIIKRLTDEEVTEIAQYGIDLFFNLESYLEKNGQPHSA